ncbi:MAG: hypothetical protein ABI873_01970 [Marmoricola sp.]
MTLMNFGRDLGRPARSLQFGSNFFELQAHALMDGRLYVPNGSLGIEGFVNHAHTFMYFGPFPALLRIPVLLMTGDFDGRLTVTSMGIAWIVFAVMTTRLLWLVRECLYPDRAVTRFDALLAALFLAAATGGTVLTFDASLPWVYHEAYLWSTALVVTSLYWMVRVALDPTPPAMRWLGLAALCTVLTRTPAGWGVCIGILGLGLWMRFGRSQADRRQVARFVLAVGAVPLVIGIAVNMAKFGNVILFPLQDQVWTSVNQHRRDALRLNHGSITGLQFFQTSLVNYFNPGGIRFVDYFPWITLPPENARAYGGAFIDQSYRTGSVTAFSTLLLMLALVGVPVLLRRRRGLPVQALRPPALAAFAMTGGVMAYGYVAYRYTSEFVPALVLGGAIGLWFVADRLSRSGILARWLRWPTAALMAGFVAFAVLANMAVGFGAAAQTYRGAPLERYVSLQMRLSGGPAGSFHGLVRHGDAVPANQPGTDQLYVRGDCEALYLNTGDAYERWVIVQERSHVVEVDFARKFKAGRTLLFTVHGIHDRTVWLQTHAKHLAQLLLVNEDGTFYGPLFSPVPGEPVRVGIGTDSSLGYAAVTSSPGGFAGYLPMSEWDRNWINENGWIQDAVTSTTSEDGFTVKPESGLPLPLCQRVAREAGLDVSG